MKKKVLLSSMILFLVLSAARFQAFAAEDKTYDQLKLLVDVMSLIQDNYVETKESKQLIVGSIKGMVKTLDPFSQFMEPEAYKEMTTETQGEFGGLGIRLSIKDGWPTVITPLPGTPAYRIGILPDDMIVKIEGKSAKENTLEDVVSKLRGKPGTKVTISIMRAGFKEPADYTIVRQIIKIETIRSKMLSNNIGYIHLAEFNANSDKDLNKALQKLREEGMKAFIFDLRNNPGGLLDVAVDVCKHFVGDDKLIVYTQGRNPESRREYRSRGKADFADVPMVLLVNRGSASGSEIVAGAMQDLKRALIVGTTTFGKASVQSIFPLEDGNALRLTTAKYYTPLGRGIHRDEATGKGGIVPDIIFEIPNETEAKLYAQAEEIFSPGKEPKPIVKETEIVKDIVLERAKELLRVREILFPVPKVEQPKQ